MTFTIDLNGRTALVTGGGQGVGRAICHALASAGASVVVNDFVLDRAENVAGELLARGDDARPSSFDVSDYGAVTDAVAGLPAVDILVNNAGNAGPPSTDADGVSPAGVLTLPGRSGGPGNGVAPSVSVGNFAESQPAEWDRYFAVNLFGVMHCTRAVLPQMIAHGEGRIITIVSDAGRWGEPRMAPYAAAKAGAAGFTRAVAREVGRAGVTVNNVALGTIDTIGLAAMADQSEDVAERLRKQLGRYIVRRLGQPEDVAGLVTFLASPMASWITGQTYPVNGGYTVNQ